MHKKNIFRYGFLLEQLVKRNFNTKYRQSVLGILWSFLNPLLTMAVQYLVFSALFRSDISHFPVYLLTGIILFSFMNECVTLGMDAIVASGPLIKKVAMPMAVYPLSRCITALIGLGLSLIPLGGAMLLSGTPLTPALLLIPAAALLTFCFALGMSLLMCTLNVFFRDTRFLWSVASLLWTYATPIFYPITIIPAAWQPVFRLNPMYQLITFMRTIVLEGLCPSAGQWGMCLLAAALPLALGVFVFRKTQDRFVFHL
ncbi:MAG: ABC transporter permease [Clostridia bacterium]|nr:ABC transporter permease [Clostridia bacterium]